LETITKDDGSNEEDHENLDPEDEHGGVVRVVNVVLVEVQLAHHLPVKRLEGHGVGVVTQAKLLLVQDKFIQVLLVLL